MYLKDWACFLFLVVDPQDEVAPSISSSVVLCSSVPLVCTATLVLVFYVYPSSVRVVATFLGTVLFLLLYSLLLLLHIYIYDISRLRVKHPIHNLNYTDMTEDRVHMTIITPQLTWWGVPTYGVQRD